MELDSAPDSVVRCKQAARLAQCMGQPWRVFVCHGTRPLPRHKSGTAGAPDLLVYVWLGHTLHFVELTPFKSARTNLLHAAFPPDV